MDSLDILESRAECEKIIQSGPDFSEGTMYQSHL